MRSNGRIMIAGLHRYTPEVSGRGTRKKGEHADKEPCSSLYIWVQGINMTSNPQQWSSHGGRGCM